MAAGRTNSSIPELASSRRQSAPRPSQTFPAMPETIQSASPIGELALPNASDQAPATTIEQASNTAAPESLPANEPTAPAPELVIPIDEMPTGGQLSEAHGRVLSGDGVSLGPKRTPERDSKGRFRKHVEN